MTEPTGAPVDSNGSSSPALDTARSAGGAASKDEKMWAMLAHLTAFSAFIIPFGGVIGPLVIWMIKKDEMPFVDRHAKEALNFNISFTVYMLIAAALMMVLIGLLLLPLVGLAWIILTIMAALKANSGEDYEYPLTFRLVK